VAMDAIIRSRRSKPFVDLSGMMGSFDCERQR
jgi:hypothetical protein